MHFLSDKFIIVGAGLAGTLMAWELEKRGVIYEVWDAPEKTSAKTRDKTPSSKPSQNKASQVAAGMFNPVSFKRLVEVWNAREHMDVMLSTYREIETFLNLPGKILRTAPIMRVFPNVQYRELWEKRINENHNVAQFLAPVSDNAPDDIIAPHGFGVVPGAGWVDLPLLLDSFREFIEREGRFVDKVWAQGEKANFSKKTSSKLTPEKQIETPHIIDCRGIGAGEDLAKINLKIQADHGEILTLKSEINTNNMCVNKVKWLLPRGNDTFKLGATYKWNVEDSIPTQSGRDDLLNSIKPIIESKVFDNFEIIGHNTGLRPASKDRRPYAGKISTSSTSSTSSTTYVLNGFGTRGVLIGPATAANLANFIFDDVELPSEINVERYSPARD